MASGARMDQVDLQITTTGKEIAMVQQNIEQVEAALEGNGVYKGIRDRVHLVARLGSFEKEKEQLRRKEEQLNERLNLLLRAGQTAAASGLPSAPFQVMTGGRFPSFSSPVTRRGFVWPPTQTAATPSASWRFPLPSHGGGVATPSALTRHSRTTEPTTSLPAPSGVGMGVPGTLSQVGSAQVCPQAVGLSTAASAATVPVPASGAARPVSSSTLPTAIRDSPPRYEYWPNDALRKEFRRRTNTTRGDVRYGPGENDVNSSLSNAKHGDMVAQMYARDKWVADEGLEPEWLMAPPCPPGRRRRSRVAKENLQGEGEKNCLFRQNDAARLIAICFSDDFYERVCKSEQPTTDRNAHDPKQLGGDQPLWREIAAAFAQRGWRSNGIGLGNPVSHEGEEQVGVPVMWKFLAELDYEAPADEWTEVWTSKDGELVGKLDLMAAGKLLHAWWEDLRSGFKIVRYKEHKRGEHSGHPWAFCGKNLANMLMLDWYKVRGGDDSNPFCQQYFAAAEYGTDLNPSTFVGSDGEDTDSDYETFGGDGRETSNANRSKGSGTMSKGKRTHLDVMNSHVDDKGRGLTAAIQENGGSLAPDDLVFFERIDVARKKVAQLEAELETFGANTTDSPPRKARLKQTLEAAVVTYEKLFKQWKEAQPSPVWSTTPERGAGGHGLTQDKGRRMGIREQG